MSFASYFRRPILSRRSEVVGTIRETWPEIVERARRAGVSKAARAVLPESVSVLGESVKTEKGESIGVLTAVVYLSPSRESGAELCPNATPACRAACLGHSSGRMRFDGAKNARLWKTVLYFGARGLFAELLSHEITAHARRAERLRLIPAVRIDGSSDTGFGEILARDFPSVQFYDYTKDARRFFDGADTFGRLSPFQDGAYGAERARESYGAARPRRFAPNYTLVFSFTPDRELAARSVLSAGFSVAVVFRGALPATFLDVAVIDGDKTDARFLDARGRSVVVGLKLKGPKPRKNGAKGFAV